MVPDELRDLPQWVGWRVEARKGKPTKVPVNPHTGKRASSTDPTTWGTYRQALAALTDGVGFVLSPDDPYVGFDLDACFLVSGALHPAAWDVMRRLNGYVETSPSGYGIHIIVRGRWNCKRHKTLNTPWGNELAAYSQGRFLTMTGDGRGQIREAQDALNALVSFYFPEPDEKPARASRKPVSDDDTAVVGKLLAHPRCASLWRGEWLAAGYASQSEADLALCADLAFHTGNHRARMDSLFRASGLFREEKWDSPRGDSTYGGQTIDKALKRA